MQYNFDKIIDRTGTNDVKHVFLDKMFGRTDLTPLWVADMDFETPDFITDALKRRLEHSLFGYTANPEDYWPTIKQWIYDHHQWDVKTRWMTFIPGIVKGIGMAINVFVKEDEKVIIQPPIYHPFRLTPQGNKRKVVFNPLIENPDGSYSMDFDNLAKVADEKCRMLILSNPHNPAGICWDRDTLVKLADFCASKGIIVISDEIHCDMALFGHKHIPFASVSEAAEQNSITFGAPSKTFNIAGIVSSYAIVPNNELRNKFYTWLSANELNDSTFFATIATMAAYKNGEEWRRQMLQYIESNILFIEDYFKQNIPAVKPLRPQASFLVWLDCRGLNLSHDALLDLFINKARLALNDGAMFGEEGTGFMRLNVACPRSILEQALSQLKEALS
ncbi:MAG: PatB family C-S lyase [Bacteroidales bacterium]|nr:PatB family C-S lyase [Bacteroidales bacterium]